MRALLVLILAAFMVPAHCATPVIFDTDIGTDIDDAYALAALIHRPELELLAVTTVSSDAVARARLPTPSGGDSIGGTSTSPPDQGFQLMRWRWRGWGQTYCGCRGALGEGAG